MSQTQMLQMGIISPAIWYYYKKAVNYGHYRGQSLNLAETHLSHCKIQ